MKTTGHYDELIKIIRERQRHARQERAGGEGGLGRLGRPAHTEDSHGLLAKTQAAPHNYHRKLPVKKAWTN